MILFLKCSGRWGRIKAEITCAMTSRYAIALYELVQLRSGLEKSLETVAIGRFRELLSVPPGKYDRVDNLMRKVIEPAVLQVNGLSDMGVMIQGNRKHSRAPVDSFNVAWWRKSPDDFRRAQQERNRSKVGRMARLKGAVETVAPHAALALPAE
jgi:plasmid replication initiation protein